MNKTPINIYLSSGDVISIQMDGTEREFLDEIQDEAFPYIKLIILGEDRFIMKNGISMFDFIQRNSVRQGTLIKSR